jgi:flagellar motor protein MotB
MRTEKFAIQAALAAALLCGCVSVEEHEAVSKQLAVEQALVREQTDELRALRAATRKQSGEIRNLKLEIAELKKAAAARRKGKALPAVAAVAKEAWAAEPVPAGVIEFPLGSYELTEKDLQELRAVAKKMAERGYLKVLIEGHADVTPINEKSTLESNMQLSALRALSVYHALVGMPGVDPARVRVVGCGEFKPRAGREKSERLVEVRYVPAAGKR